MRESLHALCKNFIENRDILKKTLSWENHYFYPICAAIFVDKRQQANEVNLRRSKELLKKYTGVFSNFRGTAQLAMISMLAVDPNPAEKMEKALKVYELLKKDFWASDFLPLAAMTIADMVQPQQYAEIAVRTRRIYQLMKKEHPFLTASEDSVLAALLAMSNMTDGELIREMETCYQILKGEFHSSNAVQTLSHVLALGDGSAQVKCRDTIQLYQGLRQKGYKYGKEYELAILGVLALLPVDLNTVTMDVIEVDNFLAAQKGYSGVFGMERKQRLMHAGMLVASDYIGHKEDYRMNSTTIGGMVALVIAQEVAMAATVAATSAANA